MNTLLVNFNDIENYTSASANIDVNKINPHIYNSQILYLEPMLGTKLYEKIIDLVNTNNITGTTYSNYKTLLDVYITPSVVFHAIELYIPLNAFKIADGGVFQYTPTNAQPSEYNDIDRIANKYKTIGSKYDDKLYKFLQENKILFVEYTEDGLIHKTETTQKIGWYIGTNNAKSKIRI